MRLQEMRAIIRANIEKVPIEVQGVAAPNMTRVSKIPRLRQAVMELKKIAALRPYCDRVEKNQFFNSAVEDVIVDSATANDIVTSSGQLRIYASGILNALDQALPPEDNRALNIKLPAIKDIAELRALIGEIALVFDQPAKEFFGEAVTFQGFDTGTSWLVVIPGSEFLLNFVGRLLDRIQKYRSEVLQLRMAEETLRSRRIANDHRLAIQGSIETVLGAVATDLANTLTAETVPESPKHLSESDKNQARNSALAAICQMSKLLDKGVEVHPSLNPPTEIQKALPEPLTGETKQPALLAPHGEDLDSQEPPEPDEGAMEPDQK